MFWDGQRKKKLGRGGRGGEHEGGKDNDDECFFSQITFVWRSLVGCDGSNTFSATGGAMPLIGFI